MNVEMSIFGLGGGCETEPQPSACVIPAWSRSEIGAGFLVADICSRESQENGDSMLLTSCRPGQLQKL